MGGPVHSGAMHTWVSQGIKQLCSCLTQPPRSIQRRHGASSELNAIANRLTCGGVFSTSNTTCTTLRCDTFMIQSP